MFDARVAGAEACGLSPVGGDDDALALPRHLRSHVTETSSFVGLGALAVHDVLFPAITGRALAPLGLGDWDKRVDYTFEPATGDYVIAATSGLVVGDHGLRTWDVTRATGELRFRLYWGTGPHAGEPIRSDVFAPDSYVTHPEVDVEPFAARVTVSFDSLGPLASLLGWAETQTSPAVFRVADVAALEENVRAITVDVRVVVSVGQPECANTTLTFATPRRSLADWVSDPSPELGFVSGRTRRTLPRPEEVTIDTWHLRLARSSDWLEGPLTWSSGSVSGSITATRGDVIAEMRVTCGGAK